MRLAVDHLCLHAIYTCKLRRAQNENCRMESLKSNSHCGRTCVWTRAWGAELVPFCQMTRTCVFQILVLVNNRNSSTYSSKVFSTSSTNFPLCLLKATSSSEYKTLWFVLCMSGLIPSASARRALRFAISHSFVQRGTKEASRPAVLEVLRPHNTDCRMRPHAQVTVIVAVHGSTSGQAEGA